jgi:hypothetical protein
MNFYPILVVGLLLLAMAVIGYLAYRAERARAEGLRRAAEEMGFEYAAAAPADGVRARFPGFHLFSQGRRPDVRNLIRGRAGGLEVSIFDYAYVTGGGKSRHTWRQTVLAFEVGDANLPGFSLRPQMWFHKVGQWLGFKDINFDTHPKFSRQYLLRSGEGEEDVRALFDDRVLEYYEGHPNVCTEACGRHLVYYRAQKRIGPAEVRSFLEEGFEVLALFRPPKETP